MPGVYVLTARIVRRTKQKHRASARRQTAMSPVELEARACKDHCVQAEDERPRPAKR